MAVCARAAATLQTARTRIYLQSWRANALQAAAARAAAEFVAQRAQDACKSDIAARFQRLWQLNAAFQLWLAAARETAAAVAAAAAAARSAAADDAAVAARLAIAGQFHSQFVAHRALRGWREALAAARSQREVSAQRARMQARIDAVLARARAPPENAAGHPDKSLDLQGKMAELSAAMSIATGSPMPAAAGSHTAEEPAAADTAATSDDPRQPVVQLSLIHISEPTRPY